MMWQSQCGNPLWFAAVNQFAGNKPKDNQLPRLAHTTRCNKLTAKINALCVNILHIRYRLSFPDKFWKCGEMVSRESYAYIY